jgi:solute carrier family 25 citrate transporter 1
MKTGNPSQENRASDPSTLTPSPHMDILKSLAKGSAMGATEVAINHPLWVMKTRLQSQDVKALHGMEKIKAAVKLSGLYNGISVNMASMVPITALQVATASLAEKILQFNSTLGVAEDTFVKQRNDVASSFTGGAVAALVATPAEIIMMHMKKTQGARATAANLITAKGPLCLLSGYPSTAMRDGIFTVGFRSGPALVEKQMKAWFPDNKNVASIASMTAAPIAGVLAALASHAFDTVKTRQQEVRPKQRMSARVACKEVVNEGGVTALFKGVVPRMLRVVSAVCIMNGVKNLVEETAQSKPKK